MLNVEFIGRVTTEFPEKFGLPKQPQLVPLLSGRLRLEGVYRDPNYLKGLETCSHLWVLFHFHLNKNHSGTTVRPPLLGGEKRMGIFSTRSPHRPNPIGLSLLKIESVDLTKCEIHVRGHDLVDGTPIIDIKPYVKSYDMPSEASFHWSDDSRRAPLKVAWSQEALGNLRSLDIEIEKEVISSVLSLDPRPRSQSVSESYGFFYKHFNISFSGNKDEIIVLSIRNTK